MNILYLGYFCKEELFNELVENGSNGSHARQQLETKLLDGVLQVLEPGELDIISYLPEIKHVRHKAGDKENYHGVKIRYLWCKKNKLGSVIHALQQNIRFIKDWAKGKEDKTVITYSANPIHVIPAILLRRKYHYKVVTICSEISLYRRNENISLAGRISRKISSYLDNCFDGYILLSKYMNEIVNKKEKPYLVMEGIASEPPSYKNIIKKRAVLYAGGLAEDNGIEILINGFMMLSRLDLELWICGDGPLKPIVEKYAKENENITYYGILENEAVQRMEQEAEVLIAPRFSTNSFTKYSFPSKTIEYMSSGTPVILTKLKGIPEEYFRYAYVLESETSEGVRQLLEKVFAEDMKDKNNMGEKAKRYVLKNKNEITQAKMIIKFISKL